MSAKLFLLLKRLQAEFAFVDLRLESRGYGALLLLHSLASISRTLVMSLH